MRIEIGEAGGHDSAALRSYVDLRLLAALGPLHRHLDRVTVRLWVRPREPRRTAFACSLSAVFPDGTVIGSEAGESEPYAAVAAAADRLACQIEAAAQPAPVRRTP